MISRKAGVFRQPKGPASVFTSLYSKESHPLATPLVRIAANLPRNPHIGRSSEMTHAGTGGVPVLPLTTGFLL